MIRFFLTLGSTDKLPSQYLTYLHYITMIRALTMAFFSTDSCQLAFSPLIYYLHSPHSQHLYQWSSHHQPHWPPPYSGSSSSDPSTLVSLSTTIVTITSITSMRILPKWQVLLILKASQFALQCCLKLWAFEIFQIFNFLNYCIFLTFSNKNTNRHKNFKFTYLANRELEFNSIKIFEIMVKI